MSVISEIKEQIAQLQTKLTNIQDSCSHPKGAVTSKHGSDTGNYDPTADRWWVDHECGLCEKRWSIDK